VSCSRTARLSTISPLPGYGIATLTVDGVPTTIVGSYTFHNVTTDHAIAAAFFGTDLTPPRPNPATVALASTATDATAITMTATTGSYPSGPVEYLCTETTGNPGGAGSGWQTDPTYTNTGLSSSTQYTYTVPMRDALDITGTASAPYRATTYAPRPAPSSVGSDWKLYR
jgi:hypothetical protein